uniref:FXYD domain-containing ion transport regulator n=1 Tax=Salmo trutta TaxID=8032 RepID=A0A673XF87_SALTR
KCFKNVSCSLLVLCAFFEETEANYERLRIGGLIIAGLLVAGGLFVLLNPKCTRKNKKSEDDTSEL